MLGWFMAVLCTAELLFVIAHSWGWVAVTPLESGLFVLLTIAQLPVMGYLGKQRRRTKRIAKGLCPFCGYVSILLIH